MNKILNSTLKGSIVSAGLLAAAAAWSPASAMIVTPNPGANGEPSLYQIMDNLYGAGNYVQRDDASTQHGQNSGQTYTLHFETRYAAHDATFGIQPNQTGFTSVMSISAAGGSPGTAVITPDMQGPLNTLYNWAYRDDVTGTVLSSDLTRNADGRNHLIIFNIINRPGPTIYVMAWEDMLSGDYDYNDAIFETTYNINEVPVPEPATLTLFGLACLGAATLGRRRSQRDGVAAA